MFREHDWKVTKLLKLRPCKITVVLALTVHDLVTRIDFCNRFLWSFHDAEVYPQLVLFMRPGFSCIER